MLNLCMCVVHGTRGVIFGDDDIHLSFRRKCTFENVCQIDLVLKWMPRVLRYFSILRIEKCLNFLPNDHLHQSVM